MSAVKFANSTRFSSATNSAFARMISKPQNRIGNTAANAILSTHNHLGHPESLNGRTGAVPTTPAPAAVVTAPQSSTAVSPAPSAEKTKEIFVKKVNGLQPSLSDRVFTKRNMLITAAVCGAVALKVAFAALAVKVGPLAASHLVLQYTLAFLQPGMYVLGVFLKFALQATIATIMNVAAPMILPILLPIVSTIVVTTIAVAVALYFVNIMMQKMQAKIEKQWENMQNSAKEGVQSLLNKVPGFSYLFGSSTPASEPARNAKTLKQQPAVETSYPIKKRSFPKNSRSTELKGLAALLDKPEPLPTGVFIRGRNFSVKPVLTNGKNA